MLLQLDEACRMPVTNKRGFLLVEVGCAPEHVPGNDSSQNTQNKQLKTNTRVFNDLFAPKNGSQLVGMGAYRS
eukprot:1668894-Amphidinium_carterae.1